MNAFSKFFSLFSRKKSKCNLQTAFHSEEQGYGTHGYLIAKCPQRGVNDFSKVRFVFIGISVPPDLTIEIHQKIINDAVNAGFEVRCLHTYGLVSKTPILSNVAEMIGENTKISENGAHRRNQNYSQLAVANFKLPSKIQSPSPEQQIKKGHDNGVYA